MNEDKVNLNAEEMEELASVEAAADSSAQAADAKLDFNKSVPYVIPLSKTYRFEGEEIKQIDLSGLEDLTTADGEYVDRVMVKLNHHPRDKFRDITYTKHIAMRVTNLPIEFFNMLKWKDQQTITSRIALYFLF